MNRKSLLLLGVFDDPENPGTNIKTSLDRMAKVFLEHGFPVITSSFKKNRWARLIRQLKTICFSRKEYEIAILPLFGTKNSLRWHQLLSKLIRINRKRLIITVDGGSIPEKIYDGNKIFIKILQKAETVVCPSKFIFSVLSNYQFRKLILIENGINLKDYPFQNKCNILPVIIWMRAFESFYNPAMAIRVAVLLKEKYPDFTLIMAGKDGPLLNEIKLMVEEFGLTKNVLFPGYLLHQDKLNYAKQASIFICTNSVDNAPVSLIEFMALGTVIVSTNVGGISEIISDGETGYLIKMDDHISMFDRISLLIDYPDNTFKIAAAARKKAMEFDTGLLLEKWLPLLN